MISFFQAELTCENLSARVNDLLSFIGKLSHDCELLFVSYNFLQSYKDKNSASAVLLAQEKDEALKVLSSKLPKRLTLILAENDSLLVIKNETVDIRSLTSPLSLLEKEFSFSKDELVDTKKSDLHIHYNTSPYTLSKQLEIENTISALVRENLTPCLYLNSVYTFEGEIYNGQSFYIDSSASIKVRAKAFEADMCALGGGVITPLFDEKYEEIFKALTFGIRAHIKETGLTKAVLGLSGGIDSTLVATLAVEALGAENVYALLMPSPHSSDHSVKDSEDLANNLKMEYKILQINECMNAFHALLNPLASEYNATDYNNSLMLQNLQSRIRAVLIMGFANALPAFVLGTGNKSEECMGYCTLYGDSCGGLFPIGDLYKEEVYDLCKWYNNHKGAEIIPTNCLIKEPSAELAPNQKDTDSLPPYPILDTFLVNMLENCINPFKVEHSFSTQERVNVLKKMKNAEFKRQQAAPILKITNVTVGKDWK